MSLFAQIAIAIAGLSISLIIAGFLYGRWLSSRDGELGEVSFWRAKSLVESKKDRLRDDEDGEDGPEYETGADKINHRDKRI